MASANDTLRPPSQQRVIDFSVSLRVHRGAPSLSLTAFSRLADTETLGARAFTEPHRPATRQRGMERRQGAVNGAIQADTRSQVVTDDMLAASPQAAAAVRRRATRQHNPETLKLLNTQRTWHRPLQKSWTPRTTM